MLMMTAKKLFFFGMEEFYSYKEKTLQKDKVGKQNTTQQKKYLFQKQIIASHLYNYKLYTVARLVPNKSIQAVQLIY